MKTGGRKAENKKPLVGFIANPEDYQFIQSLRQQTGLTNRKLIMAALQQYSQRLNLKAA